MKRDSIVLGAAVLAVLFPLAASAQSILASGDLFTDCATAPAPYPIPANGGEFYSCKAKIGALYTDWMYDLGTGRDRTPSTVTDDGGAYGVLPGNFTLPEAATDVFFNILTFPDGRIAVDSVTLGSGAVAGLTQPQIVGNALAVGQLSGTGLTLAPAGYSVPGLANRGAGPGTFPYGTRNGIEVAFAPIVDINNTDVTAGADCAWGGAAPDPALTGAAAGKGLIIGYNVYRMQATTEPTRAALGFPANFQYFLNLRDHDLRLADGPGATSVDQNGDALPDGDGADSPRDPDADGDLTGVHNPTAGVYPYDGDEVVIFQDTATAPGGVARATGTAPVAGLTYWYAVQPVVSGVIADFATANIAKRGAMDHRFDRNMDGVMDSVNLDVAADPTGSSLEFISPQADFGIQGLGLTNAGSPLLSQPVRGIMNPAAAVGELRVALRFAGSTVTVQLSPVLETAGVLGYDVYRLAAGQRLRVNTTTLLASGGEGREYEVVDHLAALSRRALRAGGIAYEVEILRTDGGAPDRIGPWALPQASPREGTRRSR